MTICEQVRKELEKLVVAVNEPEAEVVADPPAAAQEAAETDEGEAREAAAPPPGTPAVAVREYADCGFHLDATVLPEQVVDAAAVVDRHGFFIEAVTGVDWPADGQLEVVYDFKHLQELCRVVIRARLDRGAPQLPTISSIFPGANWHEREAHDFFGIVFSGHPDLSPFLLPDDADYHPLLKDFEP